MIVSAQPQQPTNPFATRWTLPGKLPFLFDDGSTIESLVRQLNRQNLRGQILGPHGSGKSTLLCALECALESRAGSVCMVRVRRNPRRAIRESLRWLHTPHDAERSPILLIDGFEQLAMGMRLWLRATTWAMGAGLVVTAHRDMGLPNLYRTCVSPQLAETIVHRLIRERGSLLAVGDLRLRDRLARHRGNLREVLFDLYDEFAHPQPTSQA